MKMQFGSSTTVCSLAATLADGSNTYNGLASYTQTQLDNSTNLYPYAKAVLSITDTFAAAPTAGSTFDLYMIEDDIDGTSDETPIPAATDIIYRAKWVGSWILDNSDVAVLKPITIDLHGVQKARFDFVNRSGQQLSYSSTATTVKITPFTYVPIP